MTPVSSLIVRRATETDRLAIDELRMECDGRIPQWLPDSWQASKLSDMLVGHMPTAGLVASQWIRIALTQNDLKDHFGFSIPDVVFPALTSTYVCSKEARFAETMRFVVLRAAAKLKVMGTPIACHIAARQTHGGLMRTHLERMGYQFSRAEVISPVEIAVLPRESIRHAFMTLHRAIEKKAFPAPVFTGSDPLEGLRKPS